MEKRGKNKDPTLTSVESDKSNQVGRVSLAVINNPLLPVGSEQREGRIFQHKIFVTEITIFDTVDLSNFDMRTIDVNECADPTDLQMNSQRAGERA